MSSFVSIDSIPIESTLTAQCGWKFDLSVEVNSAFSNYPTTSPGITGMSNLSRGWPTKWKMSKAARGKGVTWKLCKVLTVTRWHHQRIQIVIKATASTGEWLMHRGRKQVGQSQLENDQFCYQFQVNNSDTSGMNISPTLLRVTTAQRWDLRGSLHVRAGIKCWSSHLQRVDPATGWVRLKTDHASGQWGSTGSPTATGWWHETWPFIACKDSKGHLKTSRESNRHSCLLR